jgi:hypothetical protein
MAIIHNFNEKKLLEKTLEDKADSKVSCSNQPIRQAIVPYRRYDGRLIRLVYDIYPYDANSEIYRLRFNEELLNNYK